MMGISWDDKFEIVEIFRSVDEENIKESFVENYLKRRKEKFPEVAYYLEHGSWRSKEESPDPDDFYIENSLPNQCYYNAQTSTTGTLAYAEGYAIGRHVTIPHAWLEYEGNVLEITPTVNREVTNYYGVAFDFTDVAAAMVKLEKANPVVELACDPECQVFQGHE